MLSGTIMSGNSDIKSRKEINYMLQLEDRLISFFKSVENSLSINIYKELCP